MPCGLGWRSGVARRMMHTDVRPSVNLRSDAVVSKRRASTREANSTNGLTVTVGGDEKVDVTQKPPVSLSELRVWQTSENNSLEHTNSTTKNHGREIHEDSHHNIKQGQIAATLGEGRHSLLIVEDSNSSDRKKRSYPPAILSSRSDESNSTGSSSFLRSKYKRENALSVTIPETHGTKSTPLKRTNGNGTYYRRPGEPPSSPSSLRSVSSRSTRTDTTTSPVLSPIGMKTTRMIRPPPGLAPPPGFGGMDSSGALDLSTSSLLAPSSLGELSYGLQRHSQSLSTLLPPLDTSVTLLQPMRSDSNTALDQLYSTTSPSEITQNSSSLFQTIRATDEKNLEISQRASHHESFSSIDVATHLTRAVGDDNIPNVNGSGTTKLLLDSGGGFDVMGFLDNLLEESGRDENEDDNESLASSHVKDPLLLGSMWSSGRQSRAAAYGISVEGNSGESRGEEQAIVQAILTGSPHSYSSPAHASTVVVPLLTPAALGNSMVSVFDDDDDRAPPPQDYNSGDFYARLLGE